MSKELDVAGSRRHGGHETAEEWTDATEAATAAALAAEPTKKLSLAIPESVHRDEKIGAATRGNTMLAEVIELMRARNGTGKWPADVVASVKRQLDAEAASAPAAAPEAAEGTEPPAKAARPRTRATARKRAAS